MAIEHYPRKKVSRPNTQISIDSSAVTGTAVGSRKPVMIIGEAFDGKPNTVYRVKNMYDAHQIFRGGELVDALELLWNPSNESQGAGEVLAMRAEDAKNASVTAGGITFNTLLYGNHANDIQISLQTEEVYGKPTRVFNISYAEDNYNESFYDVGEIATITKDDETEHLAVEIANGVLKVETGDSANPDEVSFKLGVGEYKDSNRLINELSNIPGLHIEQPLSRSKNIDTSNIDDLEKIALVDGNESIEITAVLADIVGMLEYNRYVEVDEDKITRFANVEVTDFEPTTFEGGNNGTAPSTWANKLREFANEGGYYIVPLTDSEVIHREVSAFVNERYFVGDPMRAIVGAGYDEPTQKLLRRAANLRNPRTMLVGFSGSVNMQDGRILPTKGYMSAAQVAGIASGLDVGESVTFKQINVNSLSTVKTPSELDSLNDRGVVMAELVRDGATKKFRIVDDVTTYNDPNSPIANQLAVGEASDFLVSELKISLDETFIGSKVIRISPSLIKNHIQTFLDQKKRDNEIQDYNPEDVQVIIHGEEARISMVVYPIRTLKGITVDLVYKTQTIES